MSRWIDAEYCEDFFDRWESRVKKAEPVTIDVVENTRTLLRDAPSIELVRCKNCSHRIVNEHYGEKGYMKLKAMCELDTGDIFQLGRHAEDDEWYCADAERKRM